MAGSGGFIEPAASLILLQPPLYSDVMCCSVAADLGQYQHQLCGADGCVSDQFYMAGSQKGSLLVLMEQK